MVEPRIAGETVAQTYRKSSEAKEVVQRLRAAGFADVRISERVGETSDEHVAPEAGLTEFDFAQALQRSGFSAADARALGDEVAGGATLVTIAAGARANDAAAVVRGESVAGPALHPAAVAPVRPAESAAVPATSDERVVQLRAEALDVATEAQTTEARVRRETVTEQRTITVPVRHEELIVERDGADPVRVPLGDETSN